MVSTRAIDFQLCNSQGKAIAFSGGVAQICTAGSPDKTPTVYDINQAVIANPVALVRGRLYCEVPKAVGSVDIYMSTPTGHFVVLKGVVPGDRQEVRYDPLDLMSTWVIPFSISDSVANVEKDTGFDFVADQLGNAQQLDCTIELFRVCNIERRNVGDPLGIHIFYINRCSIGQRRQDR